MLDLRSVQDACAVQLRESLAVEVGVCRAAGNLPHLTGGPDGLRRLVTRTQSRERAHIVPTPPGRGLTREVSQVIVWCPLPWGLGVSRASREEADPEPPGHDRGSSAGYSQDG